MLIGSEPVEVIIETSAWWQILLSGAVGGVVGACATVLGAWLVIRHERHTQTDQQVDKLISEIQDAALGVMTEITASKSQHRPPRAATTLPLLHARIRAVTILHKEHKMQRLLSTLLPKAIASAERQESEPLWAIVTATWQWAVDPAPIRKGAMTAESLLEEAHEIVEGAAELGEEWRRTHPDHPQE